MPEGGRFPADGALQLGALVLHFFFVGTGIHSRSSEALAVGAVNKWSGLVLPGIIVGLLGYALGNYLGLGVAYLLRGIGVGL